MGEDAPQISLDPLVFILAPFSITDVEYQLWRNDLPYAKRVMDKLDYDEFNDTCLMPSSLLRTCSSSSHLFPFFLCIASHDDIQKLGPAASAPIDPSHLP